MKGQNLYRAIGDIDPIIVAEAENTPPAKRARRHTGRIIAAAACFTVVLVGVFALKPWDERTGGASSAEGVGEGNTQLVNPIQSSTASALTGLIGCDMTAPDGAADVSYTTIDGEDGKTAQVTFTLGGAEYTYRAKKCGESCDISGMYVMWDESREVALGGAEAELMLGSGCGAISWYDAEKGVQFSLCVTENAAEESIKSTAESIMHVLGYDMDVAPEGAANVDYSVSDGGGGQPNDIGETTFTKDGINYSFRTLGTAMPENISGVDRDDWENYSECEIGWCSAQLYWDDGGEGLALWYDIAPGLMYSLHMDSGASQDILLTMANDVYAPAQDDVG